MCAKRSANALSRICAVHADGVSPEGSRSVPPGDDDRIACMQVSERHPPAVPDGMGETLPEVDPVGRAAFSADYEGRASQDTLDGALIVSKVRASRTPCPERGTATPGAAEGRVERASISPAERFGMGFTVVSPLKHASGGARQRCLAVASEGQKDA